MAVAQGLMRLGQLEAPGAEHQFAITYASVVPKGVLPTGLAGVLAFLGIGLFFIRKYDLTSLPSSPSSDRTSRAPSQHASATSARRVSALTPGAVSTLTQYAPDHPPVTVYPSADAATVTSKPSPDLSPCDPSAHASRFTGSLDDLHGLTLVLARALRLLASDGAVATSIPTRDVVALRFVDDTRVRARILTAMPLPPDVVPDATGRTRFEVAHIAARRVKAGGSSPGHHWYLCRRGEAYALFSLPIEDATSSAPYLDPPS